MKCEEDEVCAIHGDSASCAERQLSNGELTDDLEEPAVNTEQTPESVAGIERNTLSDSLNSLDEIQPIERISSVVL